MIERHHQRLICFAIDIASKAIVFLTTVLAARLFSVDDFGYWTYVLAILIYVLLIIDFGAPQISVSHLISNPDDQNRIVAATSANKLIGCIFIYVTSAAGYYLEIINVEISLIIVLSATAQLINVDYIYRAKQQIFYPSILNLLISSSSLLIILLLGTRGDAIGNALILRATLLLIITTIFTVLFFIVNRIKFSSISSLINIDVNLIKASLYLVIGSVFARLYVSSDVFVIDFNLGTEAVGIYSAASFLYGVTITLKGVVFGVYYPYFCQLNENRKYLDLALNLTSKLAIPTSCITLLLYTFPNIIIENIFGANYLTPDSITVFRVYIVIIALLILSFFIPMSLHIRRKTRYFFLVTFFSAITNIFLNIIFVPVFGVIAAAYTTLIAELFIVLSSLPNFLRMPRDDH